MYIYYIRVYVCVAVYINGIFMAICLDWHGSVPNFINSCSFMITSTPFKCCIGTGLLLNNRSQILFETLLECHVCVEVVLATIAFWCVLVGFWVVRNSWSQWLSQKKHAMPVKQNCPTTGELLQCVKSILQFSKVNLPLLATCMLLLDDKKN